MDSIGMQPTTTVQTKYTFNKMSQYRSVIVGFCRVLSGRSSGIKKSSLLTFCFIAFAINPSSTILISYHVQFQSSSQYPYDIRNILILLNYLNLSLDLQGLKSYFTIHKPIELNVYVFTINLAIVCLLDYCYLELYVIVYPQLVNVSSTQLTIVK